MPPEPFTLRRLAGNPILHRDITDGVGRNINGPSLVTAPPWIERPLGRYYLYFAHHRGTYIRLATADRLDGPWRLYQPGTLHLAQSHFPAEGRRPHIASPDVHVDEASGTVRMYYHGLDTQTRVQHTRVAVSADGLHFEAREELLGRPYFRVFAHDGWWYALGMPGIVYRSADGLSGFERGPRLFDQSMRHSALLRRGNVLLVFWSRVGDCPERILCSPVALEGDWTNWRAGPALEVLEPGEPWEGAGLPAQPSVRGWVDEPVCQLRDPAIFEEDGRAYLLYSVAGESGIGIAELSTAELSAAALSDAGAVGELPAHRDRPAPPPAPVQDRFRAASQRVLAYVNRAHATAYEISSLLYRDGMSLTYLVQDASGRRAQLTWSRDAARTDVPPPPPAHGTSPGEVIAGRTPSGYPYALRPLSGCLRDDHQRDLRVPGEADGNRAHHAVRGLGGAPDHDDHGVPGVVLDDARGRRDQLLGDQPLPARERPPLLAAAKLLIGLGAQVPLHVVEDVLHLRDGIGRHHLGGRQVGDVHHLDAAFAAAQQVDRGVERPDSGRGPVVSDHEAQLAGRWQDGVHEGSRGSGGGGAEPQRPTAATGHSGSSRR
jgi:hypothetical protein